MSRSSTNQGPELERSNKRCNSLFIAIFVHTSHSANLALIQTFVFVAPVKVLPENAKVLYAISFFDAKNASVSRSEERVVLCLATPQG